MNRIVSPVNLAYGLASWAVPFLISFAFFDADGLTIAQPLFKSLMVVVGGASGALLLVLAFRTVPVTIVSALALGVLWMAINLALDVAVLLPMSGQAPVDYIYDIGLRYLMIPIIAVAIAAVAERQRTTGAP